MASAKNSSVIPCWLFNLALNIDFIFRSLLTVYWQAFSPSSIRLAAIAVVMRIFFCLDSKAVFIFISLPLHNGVALMMRLIELTPGISNRLANFQKKFNRHN